jgi:hypothetical protein
VSVVKKKPKPKGVKPMTGNDLVSVRRSWNSHEVAQVYVADVANPMWDIEAGGTKEAAPEAYLYGYIMCDAIVSGGVAHSCLHGTGPHSIKVCILRRDNAPRIYNHFLAIAGPKPPMWQR